MIPHKSVPATLIVCLIPGCLWAQPPQDPQSELDRSTAHATRSQTYDLKYKLQPGETLRWSVEQIASTDTRMAGHEETSSLRSRSVHSWEVDRTDSRGNMTFRNRLVSAVEWQQVGDQEPLSYDSSQPDQEIPDLFLATAEKIGKPIATITIRPDGTVVNRVEHIKAPELGLGSVTTPLPDQPVAIGAQWDTPEEIQTRRKDKSIKTVKTRVRHTLRSVEDGLAAISFRREILTPVDDPWIHMQMQQKINQGTILFDIAAGRIVKKLVQWDEQVQGFEGGDSFLRYLGSYSMVIEDPPRDTADANPLRPLDAEPVQRSSDYVKPRDEKPIIRK